MVKITRLFFGLIFFSFLLVGMLFYSANLFYPSGFLGGNVLYQILPIRLAEATSTNAVGKVTDLNGMLENFSLKRKGNKDKDESIIVEAYLYPGDIIEVKCPMGIEYYEERLGKKVYVQIQLFTNKKQKIVCDKNKKEFTVPETSEKVSSSVLSSVLPDFLLKNLHNMFAMHSRLVGAGTLGPYSEEKVISFLSKENDNASHLQQTSNILNIGWYSSRVFQKIHIESVLKNSSITEEIRRKKGGIENLYQIQLNTQSFLAVGEKYKVVLIDSEGNNELIGYFSVNKSSNTVVESCKNKGDSNLVIANCIAKEGKEWWLEAYQYAAQPQENFSLHLLKLGLITGKWDAGTH